MTAAAKIKIVQEGDSRKSPLLQCKHCSKMTAPFREKFFTKCFLRNTCYILCELSNSLTMPVREKIIQNVFLGKHLICSLGFVLT